MLQVSLVVLYAGIPLPGEVKGLTHALAGLNFTLDPFIYILTMKTFRQRVVKLFCPCRVHVHVQESVQDQAAGNKLDRIEY